MTQFLSYAIPGLPYGCVFALMAVGLVLTYQTSGVFNLAYGAQAYASALIFYVCVNAGWPNWAAFLAAVVVVAPLLGLAMDRFLYRFIRSAPVLVKLVSALGMLIVIPSALQLIFGNQARLAPPSLWLAPGSVYFHLAGDAINGTELSTVIVTLAVVLLLSLMSHFTQIGLRMRAMAESPRMVQLAGINSERVGVAIWVLSSFLAGLAGVLLAPLFAELQALNFTELLVAAIAAAALGSLTSLPLAFWGGIGLGVIQELLGGYLPSGTVLSSGLRPALPFVVLIVLLLALPGLRERWFHDDPLAGCDPPPPPMAATIGGHGLEELLRGGGSLVLAVFFVSCLTWVPSNWTFTLTQGIAYSIIFLSIVLLTGMSGQISLCQATFAGIGAFTCAQLATHFGLSVFMGIVAGGAVAAAVGVVVAMPALRLGGLALALATLAFGLLADNVGFQYSWSGNGETGVNIPRPQLGSLNFTSGKAFFVLAFILLIVCSAVVLAIRQGTTGRELAAMRGSELAAASIGTNLAKLKITVFAVAAALAGVGGAMYGSLQGTVSPDDFNSFLSLVFMVVVVTTGVYTVQGAIQAGMAYVILYQVLDYLPSQWRNLFPILFGLARSPTRSIRRVSWNGRSAEWSRRSSPGASTRKRSAEMALLEATGISKRYGGIVVLDDVSVVIDPGEAVGLVGPNGAGKTTLFDCLNGVRHFDSGEISFDGRRVERLPVYRRARLGIGRTFQRLELFAGMSPREHLMVAERVHRGDGRLWKDLIGRGRAGVPVPRVEELLVELGLEAVADDPIESLSQGHGRLVDHLANLRNQQVGADSSVAHDCLPKRRMQSGILAAKRGRYFCI